MIRKGKSTYRNVKWVVSAGLILLFVFAPITPSLHHSNVQKVEASDGGGALALAAKEYVFDAIAWILINALIDQITADVVEWIQSGFDGNPRFVEDFQGTLLQVADEQVGAFLFGTELGLLCSPFQLEVAATLLLEYEAARNFDVQCTLTDVVENTENFFAGDFLAGGFDGWFEMTQRPRNNPYGATVLAEAELQARIRNAEGETRELFAVGRGFLETEVCEEVVVPGPGGDGEIIEEQCSTVTPGSIVQERLNEALGLGEQRLLIADEINEVIAQLIAQLGKSAITSILDIDSGGIRAGEGEIRGYIHEEEVPTSDTATIQITTNCNEEGTTCTSEGEIIIEVPRDEIIVPEEIRAKTGEPVSS